MPMTSIRPEAADWRMVSFNGWFWPGKAAPGAFMRYC